MQKPLHALFFAVGFVHCALCLDVVVAKAKEKLAL